MTKTMITKTIDTLEAQRKKWEHNAFKKSNEELYQLLDDCLRFYEDIEGNFELCQELKDQLGIMKIKFNNGTSLATCIVRAVFGNCAEKREFAYARVITVAFKENTNNLSMHDFIVGRGGIEEIRRGSKGSKISAEARKKQREDAVKHFASSKEIAPLITVSNSNIDLDEGSLFVAIMRQEPNGEVSMVYETEAKSVVNSALTDAGKVLGDKIVVKPFVGNINSTKPTLCLTNTKAINILSKQFAA